MDARIIEKRLRERASKCNRTAYGICRKKRLMSDARRLASIGLRYEMKAQGVSNNNDQKTTTMTSEKISPAVQAIHESVARFVADSYLINLSKNVDATFGTLETFMMTFRSDIVAHFFRKADIIGIHNIKFRDVLLVSLARAEIRRRLEANSILAQKLFAIRAKQKAREENEARAEQMRFVALPIPKVT